MLVILGVLLTIPIVFFAAHHATAHMHHHLLKWKYHDHVKKKRGKKAKSNKNGKIDGYDVTELRSYIDKCLKWHYPIERVKKACEQIGWEKEVVEEVIKEEKKKSSKK